MSESGAGQLTAVFEAALAEFVADLRALYAAHATITTFQRLQDRSQLTKGPVLSRAWTSEVFRGKYLPSEEHTLKFVRMLSGDQKVVELWRERCQQMKKLQGAKRAAERENPTVPGEAAAAELFDLRTQNDFLVARINGLNKQVEDLNHQLEERAKTATDAETLAADLQDALYKHWPPSGVRLEGTHEVTSVAFHPDGRVLAAGHGDGHLWIWNADLGESIEGTVASRNSPVHCVAYSDNGDVLVTGGDDGRVRLADPRDGAPRGAPLVRLADPVLALALSPRRRRWSPDWQYSLAVGDRSGAVRVWRFADVPRGDADFVFKAEGPVLSLAFVPARDALAVATEFGSVMVWGLDESATGDGAPVFTGDATVRSLSFRPGTGVLAVGDAVGRVHLLALSANSPFSGAQRDRFDVGFPIRSIASCPVSPLLAIGGAEGLVLWEAKSGVSAGPPINGEVRSVAFRPDGRLIAMGMADGSTRLHTVPRTRLGLQADADQQRDDEGDGGGTAHGRHRARRHRGVPVHLDGGHPGVVHAAHLDAHDQRRADTAASAAPPATAPAPRPCGHPATRSRFALLGTAGTLAPTPPQSSETTADPIITSVATDSGEQVI